MAIPAFPKNKSNQQLALAANEMLVFDNDGVSLSDKLVRIQTSLNLLTSSSVTIPSDSNVGEYLKLSSRGDYVIENGASVTGLPNTNASKWFIHYDHIGVYAFEEGTDVVWMAHFTDNILGEWKKIVTGNINDTNVNYHLSNKSNPHGVTAAQAGARKTAGSELLVVDVNTLFVEGSYICGGSDAVLAADNENVHLPKEAGWWSLNVYATNSNIGNGCVQVAYNRDSCNVYTRCLKNSVWSEWKRLALADDTVNKSGDKMTGNLTANNLLSDSCIYVKDTVVFNPDGTRGYVRVGEGMEMISIDAEQGMNMFRLKGPGTPVFDLLKLYSNDGGNYEIFGEHNKPFGTYTGNGSATKYTVDLSALGSMCMIYCGTKGYFVLSTPMGSFAVDTVNKSTTIFSASEFSFMNGILTIQTNSALVNSANVEYAYQVL